jgi:subtilisin inhibitor-like
MIRTVIGVVAGSAALLIGGPAAAAAPDPHRGHGGYGQARSELVLEVFSDDAGWGRAVKLFCDPPGGGHLDPDRACAALERTGADPAKIKSAPVLCVLVYAPVTARITGTWRGATVKWTHTYGNECEMKRATGVLFKF